MRTTGTAIVGLAIMLSACGGSAARTPITSSAAVRPTESSVPRTPASDEDLRIGPALPNACDRGDSAVCERRCDQGEADSCGVLAMMYMDGKGVKPDYARGGALFTRACDGGDGASCFALAFMNESGKGAPRDPARARELMKKSVGLLEGACGVTQPSSGNAGAKKARRPAKQGECFVLARIYEDGKLVPADRARAETIFARTCEDGDLSMCDQLGVRLADGRLGHRDVPRAATLFKRACDEGFFPACLGLGIMTRDGLGVAEDATAARALFVRACDAGAEEACALADPKEASRIEAQKAEIRRLAKACEGGDQRACQTLREAKIAR